MAEKKWTRMTVLCMIEHGTKQQPILSDANGRLRQERLFRSRNFASRHTSLYLMLLSTI